MSAATLTRPATRPVPSMYRPDPVDGHTREQIIAAMHPADATRLGGFISRGDLVVLFREVDPTGTLFRVEHRSRGGDALRVYLLPVHGRRRHSARAKWATAGQIARVVPEVVDVLTDQSFGPHDDEQAKQIRTLTAQLEAAKAEHDEFRSGVRRAVITEAQAQGWCSRTDEWLDELGLEGRPVYTRGAVAILDGGALMAVREYNDDSPWAVYTHEGDTAQYENYLTDFDVSERLHKMVYEGHEF